MRRCGPKGRSTVLFVLLVLASLLASVTFGFAAEPEPKGGAGSGKKKLLLFAKDPVSWAVVEGGARSKIVYNESAGTFTLTATGLSPRSPYALVRYADAPPNGDIVARGTSNPSGKLELRGEWRKWTRKFWLVSGDDVAGAVGAVGTMKAWRPSRYLFEEKELGVACDCPEPEEP